MLSNLKVVAVLAVKDMSSSRKFYEQTLGLQIEEENPYAIAYRCASSFISIYESEFAGTNQATAASWKTDDVEGEVNALKEKGVSFEHYDFEGVTLEGDVHVMGETKSAWFKDPDGNILCISNGY
jgi:catechol 2,3-dioxygenase-like lactoylglutathione lyase family enzyme